MPCCCVMHPAAFCCVDQRIISLVHITTYGSRGFNMGDIKSGLADGGGAL
jgi:hypothetical protein